MSIVTRKLAASLARYRFDYCQSILAFRAPYTTQQDVFEIGEKRRGKTIKLYKKLIQKDEQSASQTINIGIPVNGMSVNDISKATATDRTLVFDALTSIVEEKDIPGRQVLPPHIARKVLRMLGKTSHFTSDREEADKDIKPNPPPDPKNLVKRPPVVTIMGHVDHGKTTLLDTLRKSRVVDQEFGGITQHIGAFTVKLENGEQITFLDTPGHAAFSAMRERGAMVTDMVVLVVAADDGVMQQTVESIKFANQAGVPIIVAVNKIDKPNADIERAKQMLLNHGIQIEDMGGDVQCIPISALKGSNLDALKEAIITQAELLDIQGDPTGMVEGTVIEATSKQGKGKLSTAIIQRGTLKKNDIFVAGNVWGKVRSMRNDAGRLVKEARPSCAVEIAGWRSLPSAGDMFWQVESEKRAQEVVRWREQQMMEKKAGEDAEACEAYRQAHREEYKELRMHMLSKGYYKTNLYNSRTHNTKVINSFESPVLSVIVKGDVDGSVDAIVSILSTCPTNMVHLQLVQYGVGAVTDEDITLVKPFGGMIYCFNVSSDAKMKQKAKAEKVQLKEFNVIYELVDDLKAELGQRVPLRQEFKVLGEAEVIQMFEIKDKRAKKQVAGSKCTSGTLLKSRLFRIKRDNEIVYEGSLKSMKHLKNEVESIKTDTECGLMFAEGETMPEKGDIVICGEYVDVRPEFEWDLNF